jgi:superfamily II DNA/RNA helicase
VSAAAIHGGRSQAQRDRALDAFKRGKVRALVATDVAARGIHVDGVACVVHYDLPADAKDYLHRAGRTGRAGATGMVVTLIPPKGRGMAVKMAHAAGVDVTVSTPTLQRTA